MEFIIDVLSMFDTVVDLVLLGSRGLLPLLRGLPLQRLAVDLDELFAGTPPRFTQPLLSHLTHLHLRDFNSRGWHTWWSSRASIPQLTHLAFWGTHLPVIDVWQGALLQCPFLKVVVIFSSRNYPNGTPPPVDPRVVELSITDYRADWECGARGGEDYWVRAELVIRGRRVRST
jgi:hypothetical protein